MHNILDLTSGNFQTLVLDSTLPVLVDFTVDWCPPYRMLTPILNEIASVFANQLRVGSIDVDTYPEIQERFGVMGLPTLLLFSNGKPLRRIVGYQPRQKIESQIKSYLNPFTNI